MLVVILGEVQVGDDMVHIVSQSISCFTQEEICVSRKSTIVLMFSLFSLYSGLGGIC